MQLPPALHVRLAGASGAAEPLPVERDPAAGAAPFTFAARQVRFPREHEFFEDGDVQRHLYLQDVLTQVAGAPERPRVPEFTCHVAGCCQVFDVLEDYEHHYHTLHRNVCSFCKRAFPSGHLLDTHILEWHDSLFQILAERQDMYQCLVEGCPERFRTSRDRKEHLVTGHLYPADFRFDKPRKSKGPATPGAAQVPAEALVDDGVTSQGDAMEVCSEHPEPSPEPSGEKRAYGHRLGTWPPETTWAGTGDLRGTSTFLPLETPGRGREGRGTDQAIRTPHQRKIEDIMDENSTWSPRRGAAERSLISLHEVEGSIPGLVGLRIWRCRELQCRSQTRLGSGVAVVV
uniref:Zinc finger protein 511 n=1 Tax=Sus scrofa TaxID=9823 RepID=A0A8D0W2Z5_PIG